MWALILDNKVIEVTNSDPVGRFHNSLAWVLCGEGVSCGWVYADGEISEPGPYKPTIAEQIAALEASITPRNLRSAALGDQFAIDKIQAVEDEIKALRE
tara:strand:+ start:4623 stop:4919 length:297 start_codon:yes stop_codon:yes gene_type:complete